MAKDIDKEQKKVDKAFLESQEDGFKLPPSYFRAQDENYEAPKDVNGDPIPE